MSLSTLTQSQPQVCRIHHRDRETDISNLLREPPPLIQPHQNQLQYRNHQASVHWNRVFQVSLIATAATTLSQVVSVPIDVGIRVNKALPSSTFSSAIPKLQKLKIFASTILKHVQENGIHVLFQGLPLHLMKRVPTKSLTVALFEIGTQLINNSASSSPLTNSQSFNNTQATTMRSKVNNNNSSNNINNSITKSATQHVTIATLSGAIALFLCYPLHAIYYAIRKYVPLQTIRRSTIQQPSILYAGALPALLGTAPAVLVDYVAYQTLRNRVNIYTDLHSVVIAAATANLLGGACSEPFKAVSRKMAVQAIRDGFRSCSVTGMAGSMLERGVGEFWRGFPARSVRYLVSAIVSKATVQHLKQNAGVNTNTIDVGETDKRSGLVMGIDTKSNGNKIKKIVLDSKFDEGNNQRLKGREAVVMTFPKHNKAFVHLLNTNGSRNGVRGVSIELMTSKMFVSSSSGVVNVNDFGSFNL